MKFLIKLISNNKPLSKMNNSLIKLFILLFSVLLFTDCVYTNEKEVNLSLDEVLVYYDSETNDYKVLSNGKHKFTTDYFYSTFSLENMETQDRLMAMTIDEKVVTMSVTYWYAYNKKGIIKLHKEYGGRINNSLILPKIRSVVRDEFKKTVSDSLNKEQLQQSLLKRINTLTDYSVLIDSKSFIITELSIDN